MLCYTKMLGLSHTAVSLFLLPFCFRMFLSFLFSALKLILNIKKKKKSIHNFFPSPPQTYLFLIEVKLLHNIALTSI